MTVKEDLKQARADLKYIIETYGSIDEKTDFIESAYHDLIDNPCSKKALDITLEELALLYSDGYVLRVKSLGGAVMKPLPIFEDYKIREIGDRWLLPIPDLD